MKNNASYSPVFVGQTSYPLRSSAETLGPVPFLANGSGSPWRLLDGPPYANGKPHLGHVLNKHLKDAMARAFDALGRNVEWRPGWDCHGLPLELAVEKLGGYENKAEFLSKAREFADSQVDLQKEVFEAQGWAAQWDSPWRTMDYEMEAGTLRVLAEMMDRGHLAVQSKAVPWCPLCKSTLSNAEQEEEEVLVETWLAPFKLSEGGWLVSWTTTPWTLPMHKSLVVNPDATYVAVLTVEGEKFWVSQDVAEKWLSSFEGSSVSGESLLGSQLEGREYSTPWVSGVVHADSRVLPDAGTGVLHAVPGLADLDSQLAETFNWETVPYLAADGKVENSPCESQNGLWGTKSLTQEVRDAYQDWGLTKVMKMKMTQPFCWRHKVQLMTRPSRQLFLKLDAEMRAKVASWVEELKFTPESSRSKLRAAVSSRPDWCLSRQRSWGVPVAVYLDRETGQPHKLASKWMRRVADKMEEKGLSVWMDYDDHQWVGHDESMSKLERMDDVLDVWFDSGCVPQLVGHSDVVVEGTDQNRGWFQSCLWVAAALGRNEPPFKRVVCHGFVVGPDGKKLSKSEGGDKSSKKVPAWNTFPTDVVRVWALGGAEGMEKAWGQDAVTQASAHVARWRGALRFLASNQLEQTGAFELSELEVWDKYWVAESQKVSREVVRLVSEGKTGEAVKLAAEFGESFSSHALVAWKDRMYCAPPTTQARQKLDVAVKACLESWVRMMGVLTPRMVHELAAYHNLSHKFEELSLEQEDVENVEKLLSKKEKVALMAEELAKNKVPPSRRRLLLSFNPSWEKRLVADVFDVAMVEFADSDEVLEVSSEVEVCPRCRRANKSMVGGVCVQCHEWTS